MTGVAILGDSPVLIFPLNERKIKKKNLASPFFHQCRRYIYACTERNIYIKSKALLDWIKRVFFSILIIGVGTLRCK